MTGLPTGATATFSPASIPAGSPTTPFTLTIQTAASTQTTRNDHPQTNWPDSPFAPVALGFLLLPLAGLKQVRRRLRNMPRLMAMLALAVLSLGAVLGMTGCGGSPAQSSTNPTPTSYAVKVIAADATTAATTSINLTLTVQ